MHASLRHKLDQHARDVIANTAALGYDEGVVNVNDPNPQYGTDVFKAGIAYAISAGTAAAYRIAIEWHGEAVVTVDANGNVTDIATTSDSGDALNGYALR